MVVVVVVVIVVVIVIVVMVAVAIMPVRVVVPPVVASAGRLLPGRGKRAGGSARAGIE
jgi:hypothetical protein